MTTRAKFRVDEIRITQQNTYPEKTEDGKTDYTKPHPQEMRTVVASPVYGDGDPNHENTKFWEASPTGKFELGTVNAEAVKGFEPGVEFYIDLTIASE